MHCTPINAVPHVHQASPAAVSEPATEAYADAEPVVEHLVHREVLDPESWAASHVRTIFGAPPDDLLATNGVVTRGHCGAMAPSGRTHHGNLAADVRCSMHTALESRMASQLGRLISQTRKKKGLGLRALARQVDKSPSFVVMIENDDPAPGVAEETLRRLAQALDLDPDQVITLAGKTPDDVVPSDELEVAIYRLVKGLPRQRKEDLLRELQRRRS